MNNNPYVLPASILAAAILVAGAMIYSSNKPGTASVAQVSKQVRQAAGNDVSSAAPSRGSNGTVAIRPVSDDEHIRGDKDAPVKLVEYSDFECPFCQRFHGTMAQVMEQYGGKVAWVYRHFPLESIHPTARIRAVASECAATLGGNDAFWQYADALFKQQQQLGGSGVNSTLADIADSIGLSRSRFASCLASNEYDDRINSDARDAQEAGGRGTPYSVVVAANGQTFPVSGAVPVQQVTSIIDQALNVN